MPAAESSLRITEAYRARLFGIRSLLERRAESLWPTIDGLDDFTWTNKAAAATQNAQREAVALTGAYLTAFLSSEVGTRTRGPILDTQRYSGLSRDGRPLQDALRSPMIGVRLKLKEGATPEEALAFGLGRAKRMVSVDYDHAHRTALLDGLAADERFQGWQRAVTGTCGACAGDIAVEVSTNLPSIPLQVHPNCQCVTEPVIAPRFRAVRKETQDKTLLALKEREDEFIALGDDEIVEVYHGAAGATTTPAGIPGKETYVTLDWFLARAYGGGEDPIVLNVRKGDLRPSPEALEGLGKNATAADSLWGVGEAVVSRETLGVLRRPNGQAIFNAKSPAEQDAMLGAEAAAAVREGRVALGDLVDTSKIETADDFITQKPLTEADKGASVAAMDIDEQLERLGDFKTPLNEKLDITDRLVGDLERLSDSQLTKFNFRASFSHTQSGIVGRELRNRRKAGRNV
jgi:hypothetical protein